LLLLSGCSGSSGFPLLPGSVFGEKASDPAPSGACPTAEKCAAELKGMMKDPKRDWIGQPQSPDGYATGTRLFAYRGLRKEMTCNELKRGLEDINTAKVSLEPARYARTVALMSDVAGELEVERGRRCR
jgi:hypothetical protein